MAVYDDFVRILADHIQKRETSISEYPELGSYAIKHSLKAIVSYQLMGGEKSRDILMADGIRYLQRRALENEICKIFEEAELPFFLVKGTAVAAYYPIPALRTMSDSDVVVQDREKAAELLEKHGFVIREEKTSDWHFSKSGVHFELHNHLLYSNNMNPKKHVEYFDHCWDYVKDNQLDWSFHFLFLIEHLRKHLVWEGVGFRQFMDMAIMIQYGRDLINWQWVREQLAQLDMDGFADVCFSLVERWFEVELPYEVPKASDELYHFATAKTLENGVFGFAGEKYKNEIEREIYVTESTDDAYGITVIKRYLGRIFPGYKELYRWPQYAFLNGRPYLLPVAWIYRLLRGIIYPEKVGKNVKWSQMSREQYTRYNEELKKWGL